MFCFSLSIKDLWGAKTIHLFIYSSTKKFFFIFFLLPRCFMLRKTVARRGNFFSLLIRSTSFPSISSHPIQCHLILPLSFDLIRWVWFFICSHFRSKHLTQSQQNCGPLYTIIRDSTISQCSANIKVICKHFRRWILSNRAIPSDKRDFITTLWQTIIEFRRANFRWK